MIKPYLIAALSAIFWLASASANTPVPAAPSIAASGYLLMDFDSGRVLAERDADSRLEPASLTKIMTAHVIFHELSENNLKLSDQVSVSEKAWKTPGSRMFIEVNSKVSVEELLKGLIIQSGNDAAVALAEHVAGSESAFANMMNDRAAKLGMHSTHYTNATGLPDEAHYTTARDVAKVSIATIRDFPDYYRWYSEREYTYNNIKQGNRNTLLWRDSSVDGVKTGHTESAGYCLVSSAKRENMRLLSVVMGTASKKARADESQSLLNYGFRFFESHKLYDAGKALVNARVWMGEQEHTAIGPASTVHITIPRRQYDQLAARTEVRPNLQAPINKGQSVGELIIELHGDLVARVPLVALSDNPEGGLWRKATDSVMQWFE